MDERKIKKLKSTLEILRRKSANIRPDELIRLAKSLGRVASPRGKEPTFISTLLPNRKPLSIPNHPGALPRYTAESILDVLEEDIFLLEEQ